MATLMSTQLKSTGVYEGLAIVVVDGFKPAGDLVELEDGGVIDANVGLEFPGHANWLVESYGLQYDELDPKKDGILWTDYDLETAWRFSVLIDAREVEAFTGMAKEAGYTIYRADEVDEPCVYGDGNGTVTLLKHPDGWVIL